MKKTDSNSVVNINLPSYICGSPDVKIRFIYDTINYNGYYGYYFWMVDDVIVFETPPYSMDIEDIVSIDQSMLNVQYSIIPINQISSNPLKFQSSLINSGAFLILITLKVNVNIDQIGFGSVFSDTSNNKYYLW